MELVELLDPEDFDELVDELLEDPLSELDVLELDRLLALEALLVKLLELLLELLALEALLVKLLELELLLELLGLELDRLLVLEELELLLDSLVELELL